MHCYRKTRDCQPAPVDLYIEKLARRAQLYSPSEMPSVLEKLESWMRFQGYPRKDIFAVTLALHEAATNAFRHGNRGDSTKYVQVTYLVANAEVLVEVKDEGRGFDPDRVPDPLAEKCLDRPGGRGLFLMRAYMSWVAFNDQGNRVTMCRWRTDL
jgi:serine/threonine-protein kinase RsbW